MLEHLSWQMCRRQIVVEVQGFRAKLNGTTGRGRGVLLETGLGTVEQQGQLECDGLLLDVLVVFGQDWIDI